MSYHRILTPCEVARPALVGNTPLKFRLQLLRGWLVEQVGEDVETLYPTRTCSGLTGGWDVEASGHSSVELGIFALSIDKIEQINAAAINPGTPEPLTRIHRNGGYALEVIGYEVIGMGQEFDVDFYQGPTNARQIPSPDGFWVLRGVTLITDQLAAQEQS